MNQNTSNSAYNAIMRIYMSWIRLQFPNLYNRSEERRERTKSGFYLGGLDVYALTADLLYAFATDLITAEGLILGLEDIHFSNLEITALLDKLPSFIPCKNKLKNRRIPTN